jgi:transcription-repair coupling factor (superfamily II helicase)
MLAINLLEQWRARSEGLVFLAENENRAERLGSILHALDPVLDVLVFPRLNTLPL